MEWIQDWGGFEAFVADLHETGSVQVHRDVTLPGKSGATRQIDVLLIHKEGLYEHRVLIECKFWKKQVERQHIDVMAASMEDLNAAKGVFFTINGFQEGAETYAKHKGIELFRVRDLTAEEWGLPGKVIDFYMQYCARSVSNLGYTATAISIDDEVPGNRQMKIDLHLGWPEHGTKTQTVLRDGTPGKTMEEIIDELSLDYMRKVGDHIPLFDDGAEVTKYAHARIEHPLEPSLLFIRDAILVKIHAIGFDLGVRIDQKRFTFDRAQDLEYACMVENCVTGINHTATRKIGAKQTELMEATPRPAHSKADPDVLQNGSIFKLYMQPYFAYTELEERLAQAKTAQSLTERAKQAGSNEH